MAAGIQLLVFSLLCSLLAGCTLPTRSQPESEPVSIEEESHLRDQLLLNELQALHTELSIKQQLKQPQAINWIADFQHQQKLSRLQRGAEELDTCEIRNHKQDKSLAIDCVELAITIQATEQRQATLKKLQAEKKAQKRSHQQQKRKQQQKVLYRRAQKAYQQADYVLALQLCNRLLKKNVRHSKAKQLAQQASTEIATQVAMLMDAGDQLYRQQYMQEAQAVWQGALLIDPQNKAITDRLKRVNQVLQSIKQIRQLTPP